MCLLQARSSLCVSAQSAMLQTFFLLCVMCVPFLKMRNQPEKICNTPAVVKSQQDKYQADTGSVLGIVGAFWNCCTDADWQVFGDVSHKYKRGAASAYFQINLTCQLHSQTNIKKCREKEKYPVFPNITISMKNVSFLIFKDKISKWILSLYRASTRSDVT